MRRTEVRELSSSTTQRLAAVRATPAGAVEMVAESAEMVEMALVKAASTGVGGVAVDGLAEVSVGDTEVWAAAGVVAAAVERALKLVVQLEAAAWAGAG